MVAATKAASESMAASFKGVSKQIEEMAAPMSELGGAISGMMKAVGEIGEAMMAAFAVEKVVDWAKEMGEAAEKTAHMSETFGMTVPQVEGFGAAAKLTGMSMDELTRAMGIFDKNLALAAGGTGPAAQAFKALGISAKDGKTQMELVLDVAEKFQGMANGPEKVALAMTLFGRAGKEMIPFLDRGREGIKEMDATLQAYGAGTLDATEATKQLRDWLEQTNQKGAALAESMNTSGVAMQGVSNVMSASFATALKVCVDGFNELVKGFIDSYREGGIVADVLDALAGTVEVVGEVFAALGEIIGALWTGATEIFKSIAEVFGATVGADIPKHTLTVRNAFNMLIDIIVAAKNYLLVFIYDTVGPLERWAKQVEVAFKSAMLAVHGDWAGAEAAWKQGTQQIADMAVQQAARVKTAWQDAMAALNAFGQGKDVNDPKGEAGGGAGKPPAPGIAKTPKEKKGKDDLLQHLEEQLTAKKMAWDEQQDAQDTAQKFSLGSERDFWAKALEIQSLSAKDRAAIETKLLAVKSEIRKEEIEKQLEGFKQELAAAGQNSAAKLAILEREKAFIVQKYGAESKEAAAAQTEITKATEAGVKQREQIELQHAKAMQELDLVSVDAAEAAAKFEVDMGRTTKAQLIQQERQFENDRYQIKAATLAADLKLIDPNRDPAKYQQVCDQIKLIETQHQKALTLIDQQAALERTRVQRAAITSISQSWSQSLSQMMTGMTSFANGIKSMWQGVQQMIAQALATIMEQWLERQLATLLLGKAQQGAAAIGQIQSNAAIAGSAAFASMHEPAPRESRLG